MSKNTKQIIWSIAIYICLRLFSYWFNPPTPLWSGHLLNSLMALVFLILASYWLIKKDMRGWIIIAGEIILGGGGGYLSIGPLALRTALLVSSLAIYFFQLILDKKLSFLKDKFARVLFLVLAAAILSAIVGFINSHNRNFVISDFIPYLFILYYFPLRDLIREANFLNISRNLIFGAVIGCLLFAGLTFAGFSSGIFVLQDHYYHWFRDVAGGKITDLGFSFFRVTLNEYLLLVPLLLMALYKIIIKESLKIYTTISAALIFILAMNLTRIYLLAFLGGLILLIRKSNWRRTVMTALISIICFFIFFLGLHLIASRGQSAGWELFGLRLSSIAAPDIEESSLSRMLLLPKILEKISSSPIIGTGLGDTVTVFSPVLNQTITTPHFDWGYLEIAAEMGIIGVLAWLILITYLLANIIKKEPSGPFLAAFGALLIINLTSPALFHVFGAVLIAVIAALTACAFQEQSISSSHNP